MKTFKLNNSKDFFVSKEQYQAFIKHWSDLCADENVYLSKEDYFVYKALRGQDIGSQFSPITSRRKFPAKGPTPYYALECAYDRLTWIFNPKATTDWGIKRKEDFIKKYEGYISIEQMENLLSMIPHPKEWDELG